MKVLSEFERKAWDTRDKSTSHAPELALKVALQDALDKNVGQSGDKLVNVVVLAVCEAPNSEDGLTVYMAGKHNISETVGQMFRAMRMLDDDR